MNFRPTSKKIASLNGARSSCAAPFSGATHPTATKRKIHKLSSLPKYVEYIFELVDKTGRKIRLTAERWSHIQRKHPEVEKYEWIEETLIKPDIITDYDLDETVRYYYKYYKHRAAPEKYLHIVVKYINSEGFVLTAQFKPYIR